MGHSTEWIDDSNRNLCPAIHLLCKRDHVIVVEHESLPLLDTWVAIGNLPAVSLDPERTAGLDMAVALIEYDACGLAFEFSGKGTTLFGDQTPLSGEHSRLYGCPASLDHYKEQEQAHQEFVGLGIKSQ